MKPLFKTSILIAALALAACAPEDPMRAHDAPPKAKLVPHIVTDAANVHNKYESPKVDVLFVMDNSLSMQNHQDKLIANIDKFAEAFIKNTEVDFHVGVVKVYDSKLFSPGQPTFVPNGQLLKGFVARGGDTVSQLQSLLKIGVLTPAQGGPEFEEVFSPIKAALTEPMLSTANAGFYRPEAHLAVIMITDANDGSENFDDTNLAAFLVDLKNKRSDKVSIYAVLANPGSAGESCKTDPSGPPVRINNLIKEVSDGHKFSLCDQDYGNKLAKVGSDIAAKTIFNRAVELTNVPDERKQPIVVKCEGAVIPRGHAGWDMAPGYKVVISPAYPNCKADDAVIEVTYETPGSDKIEIQ